MTVAEELKWTWDIDSFLRAEDAGVFGRKQVELIGAEVRCVVHGSWHGRVVSNLIGELTLATRATPWRVTTESLVLASGVPDPDTWLVRRGATATGVGRVRRYEMHDVLLVVEVADASLDDDLGAMATMYSTAGVQTYWVVAEGGVHVHDGPTAEGYSHRRLVPPNGRVEVPTVGHRVGVAELLAID